MKRIALLAVILPLLLTACATAPSAQNPPTVVNVCPRLPALEPLDPETQAALETDFTGTIARLLSGLAPLATDYGLRSNPAVPRGNGIKPP